MVPRWPTVRLLLWILAMSPDIWYWLAVASLVVIMCVAAAEDWLKL
jgi:hypothetical protein